MMPRWILILGLTVVASTALGAGKDKKPQFSSSEQEKMMEHVRGTFDMARNPRPYIVYVILDQKDNRYPSFWCGRNVEGKIAFKGALDPLDDKINVTQTGNFTVQLTNSARKYGMFDVIPGGVWAQKLAEANFRVVFEAFSDVVLQGLTQFGGDRSIAGNLVTMDSVCRGKVLVGERSAPFTGKALLKFSDQKEMFLLHATFPFPGQELGLEGSAGQNINATLYTASTPATSRPEIK
jgi:hypothetical protein